MHDASLSTVIDMQRRRILAERDGEPLDAEGIVRCGVMGCGWSFAGTLGDGAREHRAHRRAVHPELVLAATRRAATAKAKAKKKPGQVSLDDETLRRIEAALRERPMTSAELGELVGIDSHRFISSLSWCTRRKRTTARRMPKTSSDATYWHIDGETKGLLPGHQAVVDALADGPLTIAQIGKALGKANGAGTAPKLRSARDAGLAVQRADKRWARVDS